LALAFEGACPADRDELSALLEGGGTTSSLETTQNGSCRPEKDSRPLTLPSTVVEQVRALFERAGVFDKAGKLIEKFRARAEAVADDVEPTELRELLYFLVDTVLDLPSTAAPESEPQVLVQLSK
jgi:hypothetical protein